MSLKKATIALLLVSNLILFACVYIVVPEELASRRTSEAKAWEAAVTNVSQTAEGDLHIDLTLRNETGEWSSMKAVEGSPAILSSGGKSTDCDTVYMSTGGHRLAPGFQMRGYVTGTKSEPITQLLYVECQGAQAAPGAKLTIEYIAFNGDLDYYHQDMGKNQGKIVLELDEVVTDLVYPLYDPVDGLVKTPDTQIIAISENVITLLDVERTADGLELKWQNTNPTEFPLKTHIGTPPVIGSDGILYGRFEIMDLAPVPLTPAGGSAEWTTRVDVPADVSGFYILLSVESKQPRWYINHALDITTE